MWQKFDTLHANHFLLTILYKNSSALALVSFTFNDEHKLRHHVLDT